MSEQDRGLIERLLAGAVMSVDGRGTTVTILTPAMNEAAATITELRAENARLRDALQSAPIPARGEEMTVFRDRQDKWLATTYAATLGGKDTI
jgi:hypothetical protein